MEKKGKTRERERYMSTVMKDSVSRIKSDRLEAIGGFPFVYAGRSCSLRSMRL